MFTPLLAKLPAHPVFSDALNFILTGFFLVIGALLILSGLIAVVGYFFKSRDTKAKRTPATNPAAPLAPAMPSAPVSSVAGDDEVLAAVIAAAVHVALEGQPHRVIHIEPVSVGWAREGRREIFSSHRVR